MYKIIDDLYYVDTCTSYNHKNLIFVETIDDKETYIEFNRRVYFFYCIKCLVVPEVINKLAFLLEKRPKQVDYFYKSDTLELFEFIHELETKSYINRAKKNIFPYSVYLKQAKRR